MDFIRSWEVGKDVFSAAHFGFEIRQRKSPSYPWKVSEQFDAAQQERVVVMGRPLETESQ